MRVFCLALCLATLAVSISRCSHAPARLPGDPRLRLTGETHWDNLRQLTHDGQNLQARWSLDGTQVVFLRRPPQADCAQAVISKTDGTELHTLFDQKGGIGGAVFMPEPQDDRVLLSSTYATEPQCPLGSDFPSSYKLYTVKTNANDLLPLEPAEPRAYNSEPTVCKDGSVVFTSDRDGDLELYRGKLDRLGTLADIVRITHLSGYDGGAAFSPDCKKIAWQASRPRDDADAAEDKALLKQHKTPSRPTEIWVANADGSQAHQATRLNAQSESPAFLADGERILFASNARAPQSGGSDLYLVRWDGTGLERVSFSEASETHPMFSPDGKTVVFSSTRVASEPSPNILMADWAQDSSPPLSLADPMPENRFKAWVQKLSSPELEGRALGTAGLAKAEALITDQFVTIGLKTLSGGGFAQKVEIAIQPGEHVAIAHNLVGTWGTACAKTQPIVLGAHLDHPGRGGPGADSNASGVAALLEVARLIEASGVPEAKSCFIFAAFTGEENGIIGSSRLVALLKGLKIRPKAMLNLDRVGRLESNHLIVFGTESAKEWRPLLAPACSAERLRCEEGGDGYGPSDQMAFYQAGVPVLHFFSGTHADYHHATDTADKINATGAIQITHVVAAVAIQAASRKQALHFLKASAVPAFELPIPGADHPGHGSYLGTIPDYAALGTPHNPGEGADLAPGVRLAGTRPGSPASKAGVKTGDVLTALETPAASPGGAAITRKIRTLEDFMGALLDLSPGDSIKLHVRRGTQDLTLSAQVGKR